MNSLRRLASNTTKPVWSTMRSMSASAGPLVNVAMEKNGTAIVTLQRLPVNSLNLDLIQEISKTLDDLAKNKTRATILTSASPTVFSAGLDIMEMYKPDMKRAETFWTELQEMWMKYFGSDMITTAAINGHAPAGGCLLALSSEYRAMVNGKYAIGLNETALGIVAPFWFQAALERTIPLRQAEIALTLGKMFPVTEAHKIGLIDDVATDKEDAISKCKTFIKQFDRIPPMARAYTKRKLRGDIIQKLKANQKQDTQEFLAFLKTEQVQQGLEMYIASLKQKAAK